MTLEEKLQFIADRIKDEKEFFIGSECDTYRFRNSKLKGKDIKSEIDIMTYSFPCQDLSKAGKQQGMGEGSRSGLVYEVLRIVQELKETNNLPKVLIMENVTDLVGAKFINEFNQIQLEIEGFGYTNYVENLNAKNYGIAQNRDRTFMVSILGDYNYEFPKQFNLSHRLKDYLEEEVDEKYYLSDKALNGIKNTTYNSSTLAARTEKDGVIPTLCARDYKDPKLVVEPAILTPKRTEYGKSIRKDYESGKVQESRHNMTELQPREDGISNTLTTVQKDNLVLDPKRLGGIFDKDGKRRQAGAIWDKEHLAPTLDTMQGGWRQPSVVVAGEMRTDEGIRTFSDNIMGTLRTTNSGGDKIVIETLEENDVEYGDSINAVINKLPTDSDGVDFVGYLDGNKRIKNPTEDQLKLSRTHRQVNRIHSDKGIHPALSASEVSGRYNIMGDTTNLRIASLLQQKQED